MDTLYTLPPGVHCIPTSQLDLRPDTEIDHAILHPAPITSEKNIWLFWHTGYASMHPYTRRNVRVWHRRFSKSGWTVRVIDRAPDSASNISNFIDVNDPTNFPQAFRENTLTGTYALQHTSDLVRFPLLLKYGGVYADVGMIQIGDLEKMWNSTVGNDDSEVEVLSYNCEGVQALSLANYFLGARKGNAFFERCHRLLLKLWEGRVCTEGMHTHPLVKGVPLMTASAAVEMEGRMVAKEEVSGMLTDYIIQGHVVSLVMGLVDEEGGWNGPEYVRRHIYGIDYMVGSQLVNELTAWNGVRAFELMSLTLPREGEEESADQAKAREIVEACLSRSFGFKLAHGFILQVFGDTLGSLWRKHEGSDNVPFTYAHWLRYGVVHWCQDELPLPKPCKVLEPYKVGPLLRERNLAPLSDITRTAPNTNVRGSVYNSESAASTLQPHKLTQYPKKSKMKPLHPEWTTFIAQNPNISHDGDQLERNARYLSSPAGSKLADVIPVDDIIPTRSNYQIPIRSYAASDLERYTGLVIFFHSGGLTCGSLETEDVTCRHMALAGPVVVISVDYRLAPEHPYPTPMDDAWAVFRHVITHLDIVVPGAIEPVNLVLAGTSAGGQLAAIVSQRARHWLTTPAGMEQPVKINLSGVLLRAPVTVNGADPAFIPPEFRDMHRSWNAEFETARLDRPDMQGNHDAIGIAENDRGNPGVYPLWGKLSGLPKTYIQICDVDILRDDAVCYARGLRDAGVEVREALYKELPHIFWIYGHELEVTEKAQADCVKGLQWLLGWREDFE